MSLILWLLYERLHYLKSRQIITNYLNSIEYKEFSLAINLVNNKQNIYLRSSSDLARSVLTTSK